MAADRQHPGRLAECSCCAPGARRTLGELSSEELLGQLEAAQAPSRWRPLRRLGRRPLVESQAAVYRAAPWLPVREVTARLFSGQRMRVTLPELASLELYRFGYIEPGLTRALLDHLKPGMVVIDVGAHYGYYSLLAHRLLGPTGAVFAFEPSRSSFRLLRRNAGRLPNVHLHSVAVGAAVGSRLLSDFGARHSSVNTVQAQARIPARDRKRLRPQSYEVEVIALDTFLATRKIQPDFVKIDAESSELEVLRGMRHTLASSAPLVSLEVGDYDATGAKPLSIQCVEFLAWLGYSAYEYQGQELVRHEQRPSYGYGNLLFAKTTVPPAARRSGRSQTSPSTPS